MRNLKEILEGSFNKELKHGESCFIDVDKLTEKERYNLMSQKHLNFILSYTKDRDQIQITANYY